MNKILTRRAMSALMAASCVLAAGACTTYQAPELPADELASIEIDPKDPALRFTSVDGAYMSSTGTLMNFSGRKVLKLRPGQRRIVVTNIQTEGGGVQSGHSTLVFEAQAAKRYTVRQKTERLKFYTWITDETGANVPLIKTGGADPAKP